jgi:DNA mismatch repair protein MutS
LKWVQNFSVAVWENDDNIVFLRKIIPWWMKKSYWIEVAKLAWISSSVIQTAKDMLYKLEKNSSSSQLSIWTLFEDKIKKEITVKATESKIENEIKKLNINSLTPIEALNFLYNIKQ